MDYGVGITNRYAFLEDNDEEVAPIEAAKMEDKKVAPASDAKKVKGSKTAKPPKFVPTEVKKETVVVEYSARGRGASTARGGRGAGRGGRKDQDDDFFNRRNVADKDDFEAVSGRGNRSSRGDGSGRGRGGRGGNSYDQDRDRGKENQGEFESSNRGFRSSRGDGSTRGDRGGGRGRGGERGGGRLRDSNNYDEQPGEEPHEGQKGGDYVPRGVRGSRGGSGYGGRGVVSGGRRRDFDRVSGSDKTGVKPIDKRDGSGAHNWGSYKDDEFQNEVENRPEDEVADGETPAENGQGDAHSNENEGEGENKEEQPKGEPAEEEAITLTLEEWKAMQQPRATPVFNIRKPNDGEDPSKWKNLVLKKKTKEDDDDEYEEGEDIWAPQRAGREKRITDIGFHFVDDRENERGFRRGGRGGFKTSERPNRTGYSSRRDRQYGNRNAPPRVDDVNDFPTL